MQIGNEQKAVPGIDVHIQSTDGKYNKSIRVFSDGSFYQTGIPPGNYIAFVDPIQLNILGAICSPSSHPFNVRITANGDYIEGMNFILTQRQTEKSVSNTADSSKTKNILSIPVLEQKYKIEIHEKPKGFFIHISTWDTDRQARREAKYFNRDTEVKTFVEKIIIDGNPQYAVQAGIFPTKEKAIIALHKILSNE